MPLTKGQKIALGVIAGIGLTVAGVLWWKNKKKAKEDVSPSTGGTNPVPQTAPVSPNTNQDAAPVTNKQAAANGIPPLTDVLAFQKWFNVKGFTPKLKEDGIDGVKTTPAYLKYGKQYVTETKK